VVVFPVFTHLNFFELNSGRTFEFVREASTLTFIAVTAAVCVCGRSGKRKRREFYRSSFVCDLGNGARHVARHVLDRLDVLVLPDAVAVVDRWVAVLAPEVCVSRAGWEICDVSLHVGVAVVLVSLVSCRGARLLTDTWVFVVGRFLGWLTSFSVLALVPIDVATTLTYDSQYVILGV